jgi:fused signal recognition particle receptor
VSWRERLTEGLSLSRERIAGQLNALVGRGVEIDEGFWGDLEDTLILSDLGLDASEQIVSTLRREVAAKAFDSVEQVKQHLVSAIAAQFETAGDPLNLTPATVLAVGINGTGKTTSVGKLAKQAVDEGKTVILGSADTFRAAAAEQLDVWAERAQVPIIKRDRGADAASVAYETVERAEREGVDLTLIDTAGRLHTSRDLMRELEKVQRVTRERSKTPTFTILVMDATAGQNGLVQAREFNEALALDAIILTKLDGTAKGGIALAVSHELGIPIVRIGVGEGIDDLRPFDPLEFSRALIGD